MTHQAVRVTLRHRSESPKSDRDARESFWQPLRNREELSTTPAYLLESRLENGVAAALKARLVQNFTDALSAAESRPFGRDLEHLFERWFFDRPSREPYAFQFGEVISRLAEIRERLAADTPGLAEARQKAALAASSVVAIRISRYGSLEADVLLSPISAIGRVFDYDADALQVFLQAFLPVAFADVFDGESAAALQYDVQVPDSLGRAMSAARSDPLPLSSRPKQTPGDDPSQARQKAELLWRIANGTLVLPVLLALLVMFYGFKELSAIRTSQLQLLQPILEHQAALLQEDRVRLGISPAPDSTKAPVSSKRP